MCLLCSGAESSIFVLLLLCVYCVPVLNHQYSCCYYCVFIVFRCWIINIRAAITLCLLCSAAESSIFVLLLLCVLLSFCAESSIFVLILLCVYCVPVLNHQYSCCYYCVFYWVQVLNHQYSCCFNCVLIVFRCWIINIRAAISVCFIEFKCWIIYIRAAITVSLLSSGAESSIFVVLLLWVYWVPVMNHQEQFKYYTI